jgi:hypothetical protein
MVANAIREQQQADQAAVFARPAIAPSEAAQRVAILEAVLSRAETASAAARTRREKQTATKALLRARRHLAEARADLDREQSAEKMAPAAQIAAGRIKITERHGRAFSAEVSHPLAKMHADGTLQRHHMRAADLYIADWEAANAGQLGSALAGADEPRRTPGSGNARIEFGVGSSKRLEQARAAIGRHATALLEHKLQHGSITEWAIRQDMRRDYVTGALIAALDRLAEHYAVKPVEKSPAIANA